VLGQTDIPTLAICILAVLAAASDLAFGRIFNGLTVSFGVAAIIYAGMNHGLSGVGASLLGILVGFLLYSWMFWLRVLGGGDVKLLMAFGAWGGTRYTLDVALLGIMLGGVMAVFWLAMKGKFGGFVRKAQRFIMSLVVRELEVEKFEIDRRITMPFGIPISIAAVWVQFGSPFVHWGGVQ
jgi:prepilin peptidase CpaA